MSGTAGEHAAVIQLGNDDKWILNLNERSVPEMTNQNLLPQIPYECECDLGEIEFTRNPAANLQGDSEPMPLTLKTRTEMNTQRRSG